jgi:hypothetical protein
MQSVKHYFLTRHGIVTAKDDHFIVVDHGAMAHTWSRDLGCFGGRRIEGFDVFRPESVVCGQIIPATAHGSGSAQFFFFKMREALHFHLFGEMIEKREGSHSGRCGRSHDRIIVKKYIYCSTRFSRIYEALTRRQI